MKANGRRTCPICGTPFTGESCPVCALQGALKSESGASSIEAGISELRFEHYRVLQNQDGTPTELGHGAMGVTYKAFDIHLQCPVALKIINARFIGDDSAHHRFVREARAAASVRHPNVASVFHLGESEGNYFYVMEFVEGETLEKLIRRSGTLEADLALEVVAQVAAGLTAIQKQHLVHRDIKPSNIMVSLEEDRLESVKIVDLGLAKVVAEEDTISTAGSFTGTPGYASPEQFAGFGADIRSDLYSLGITLWEMLVGKLPFQGSGAELMYQHQHAALPIAKLKNVPSPIEALLEVLLAKDPGQRFQSPAQLRNDDREVLSIRLSFALQNRDWPQAKEVIQKMKDGEDDGYFAYGFIPVPIHCYFMLLARLQGEQPGGSPSFSETREQLSQKVLKSPGNAPLLSQLAVVDALLSNKEAAIADAKRAIEMMPTSTDAVDGPCLAINLAVVYAWTNEIDLAFETLGPLTKTPSGIFYGQLKRDPYWEPLRQDPRFEKLLAELAPKD